METTVTLDDRSREIFRQHELFMHLLSRSIACHCECMGMQSDNAHAVGLDQTPPYSSMQFQSVLQKWGLVNEKGEPTI